MKFDSAAVALTVGLFGGLVGQGGSFILIPMTVYLLKVPLRVAMGSNLVIVFFASPTIRDHRLSRALAEPAGKQV